MDCPNCKKESRCGCKSCKSRVKYHALRANKIQNHPLNKWLGIITCPYCRSKFSDDELLDYEYEQRKTAIKVSR